MRVVNLFVILAAALAICVLSPTPVALGTSIQVETTSDEVQFDGMCSLRQAIEAANFDVANDCPAGAGASDIIYLPDGEYTLTLDFLGGFVITEDLRIVGTSRDLTIIDGDGENRIFMVDAGIELNLIRMKLRNGNADTECGGAIYTTEGIVTIENMLIEDNYAHAGGAICNSGGSITLEGARLTGNHATTQHGGGIYNLNDGLTAMDYVEVSDNHADASLGGGIANSRGILTINHSLIAENTANFGGGLNNGTGGSVGDTTIINSTFSGNEGAAIANQNAGILSLLHVTVAQNSTGIHNISSAQSTIQNSLIDDSCIGDGTSLGNNLDTSDEGCPMAHGGPDDIQADDPVISPLQQVLGFTRTHALFIGSPAIDAANDTVCPIDDQQSIDRPAGNGCDIGAYESPFTAATPTPSSTPEPSETPTPTATATPSPTVTPCPTVSPTNCDTVTDPPPTTSTPATETVVWGDNNCSGQADPVDSLLALRHDAGLSANTGECPPMGTQLDITVATLRIWGDVDCSDAVDPVDSLKLLRFDAGLSVVQAEGCPNIGSEVAIQANP